MPQARLGQSVPSGMQAIPVFDAFARSARRAATAARAAGAGGGAARGRAGVLDDVPCVGARRAGRARHVPPSPVLAVPAAATTLVPAVLVLVFPAADDDVPPSPVSGVFALEQPETDASATSPTAVMPTYTLIMGTSFFRECIAHEVRKRPSP